MSNRANPWLTHAAAFLAGALVLWVVWLLNPFILLAPLELFE